MTCPAFTAGNAVKIVTKAGKTFMTPTNKPAELSKVINSLCKSLKTDALNA
jgi:hypothetical protein